MQNMGSTSGINPTLMNLLYDTTPEELIQIDSLTKGFSDDKLQQTILLCCLLGFVFFAGIHRFIMGQIGMGILYLLTAGLCLIGTIVDAINYKQLALEHNQQMIGETLAMLNMSVR